MFGKGVGVKVAVEILRVAVVRGVAVGGPMGSGVVVGS